MKITEQIDNLSKIEESSYLTMDYETFASIFGENFSEKVYETKRSSLNLYYLFFEEDEELYYTIFDIGPSKDNTDLYHILGDRKEFYCKINDSIIEELASEEYRIENEVAKRLALIKELTSHPSVRLKKLFLNHPK